MGLIEPFKNFAPVAVIACAAAMTLVDDNQVEKILRIIFVKAVSYLVASNRLINCEIYVATFADFSSADLEAGISKDAEILVLGVVYKDIAICEEKNFGLAVRPFGIPATIPKLP